MQPSCDFRRLTIRSAVDHLDFLSWFVCAKRSQSTGSLSETLVSSSQPKALSNHEDNDTDDNQSRLESNQWQAMAPLGKLVSDTKDRVGANWNKSSEANSGTKISLAMRAMCVCAVKVNCSVSQFARLRGNYQRICRIRNNRTRALWAPIELKLSQHGYRINMNVYTQTYVRHVDGVLREGGRKAGRYWG